MGKWEMVRLGDVAPVIQSKKIPQENNVWLLNLDVVEANSGKVLEYIYVPANSIGSSTIKFDENNLLYSKLRPYLNKVVVPNGFGYATSEMLPLYPNKEKIDRKYLTLFLRSKVFVSAISGKVSGTKMPRVVVKEFKEYLVPLPPLEVQRKIAETLDAASELLVMRKKQLTELDVLIQSVFYDMFGDPEKNEKGWEVRNGEKLFNFTSGKFNPTSNLNSAYEYPCYGGNGITGYSKNYLVDFPTIVIGRVGVYCGSIYLVEKKAWITDNAIYLKKFDALLYRLAFLKHLFEKMNFNRFADFSGQPKITQQPLLKTEYIVPPLSLQTQFAETVQKIEEQKALVQKAIDETQALFDSLMGEYFE